MTPADRRLAAAAAAIASLRAARLLSRGPCPEAAAEAARLASLTRDGRVQALAAAMQVAAPDRRARSEQAAARERPRVGALLRRLGQGRAPDQAVAPVLRRLCQELLVR